MYAQVCFFPNCANARRQMGEIKSSGMVAPAPFDAVELSDEPAVAPFPQY